MSQRKNNNAGEINEGYLGGGDGEYPPMGKIEKSHVVDHPQKRRKSQRFLKDLELEFFKDLEDMEIDVWEQILYWVAMQLPESRELEKELDHEGPVTFEDELVVDILPG